MNNEELKQCGFTQTYYAQVRPSRKQQNQIINNITNDVLSKLSDGTPKFIGTDKELTDAAEDKGLAMSNETGNLWTWDKNKIDETHPNGSYVDSGIKYTVNESIPDEVPTETGEELVKADGWTLDGWTGDYATGFKHTSGQTGLLSYNVVAVRDKVYVLEFDVESPSPSGAPNKSTAFAVTIGDSYRFVTYNGGGSKHYKFGLKSRNEDGLVFIPTDIIDPFTSGGEFDGTIKNVSLKEVLSDTPPSIEIKDTSGEIKSQQRYVDTSIFIGKDSGSKTIGGLGESVIIGNGAAKNNTTGYWNVGVGERVLEDNIMGSRNVALGYIALEHNISGDRNVAIGSFALNRNTSGRNNIAIGADSLWYCTTGEDNVALSLAALAGVTTGSNNIGIGKGAVDGCVDGNHNIGIGRSILVTNQHGSENIGIGGFALLNNAEQSGNVAIGFSSQRNNIDGNHNVSMGRDTLSKMKTGSYNVAIGEGAGKGDNSSDFYGCTLIGNNAGAKLSKGAVYNTIIGSGAGENITTGTRNVLIGYGASTITPTDSNKINISDTLYGDRTLKGLYIGGIKQPEAYLHLHAGKNAYPCLMFEKGVFYKDQKPGVVEYDGKALYITFDDGVRKKFVVENS